MGVAARRPLKARAGKRDRRVASKAVGRRRAARRTKRGQPSRLRGPRADVGIAAGRGGPARTRGDRHARPHGSLRHPPCDGCDLSHRLVSPRSGAIGGRVRRLGWAANTPASSGNTVRYRPSRQGDHQLNRALCIVARARMAVDPETRAYVARRAAEGKTAAEIRRILKRDIARRVYHELSSDISLTPTISDQADEAGAVPARSGW
ncbi:transposase [Microbacterium sp.]|uniref:transposase n=1 Tax=Microbacterium sp. TaxID=51671 RepID=UPI003A8EA53F